jgi:predicted permease
VALTLIILSALLPVLLILCLGALLRRTDLIPPVIDPPLTRLIIKVLYPCLVFSVIYDNEILRDPKILLLAPILGFASVIIGFIGGLVVGRILFGNWLAGTRALALTVGVFNYGYFALPLCLALFGPEVAGVLVVFNLGVEIAFWTMSPFLSSAPGQNQAGGFKSTLHNLVNPPVVGIFLGIALNSIAPTFPLPQFVVGAITLLGQPAIPIALLLIGALLYDLTRNRTWWRDWKVPAAGIALRLGILPLLILSMGLVYPLPFAINAVLVIQAGLPAGIFPLVLLKLNGGDTLTGLRVILFTTLFGLIATPFWIVAGGFILGTFPE